MIELALMLVLAAGSALAGDDETPTPDEADSLYRGAEWERAAEAYQALVSIDPHDGDAWFRLGFSYYKIGRFAEASVAWKRAMTEGAYPVVASYNVAAALSLLGQTSEAYTYLEQSVAMGFAEADLIREDADFAAIRHEPRFQALVERVERNARPCMYDARFREFDFLVGDWVVRDLSGGKVGSSRVKLGETGCALSEQWTDAFGHTATALIYFDPHRNRWLQTRVGANGQFVQAEGGMLGQAMVLEGTTSTVSGDSHRIRTTWEPRRDGALEVSVELSPDGRTWKQSFQGTFRSREYYGLE